MSIPPQAGLRYNKTMLKDYLIKVKSWFAPKEGEVIIAITIVLVALIGFGLGRLSASKENKFPIRIQAPAQEASVISSGQRATVPTAENNTAKEKLLVGSKNGQVYHFPWCSGAQRIKEENKIFFASRDQAQKAGYRPAANCEGL